jgi:hypothetical protein
MACQMARYINLGSQPIKLGIGTSPGLPWTRYDSAPGGVVEGPAGYLRAFSDAGYTLVTHEIQTMLDEDAAKKAAPKVEAPVEVKIEQVEPVTADPDQITLGESSVERELQAMGLGHDPEPSTPDEPEDPQSQDSEAPAQPVAHDPAKGRRRGRNQ